MAIFRKGKPRKKTIDSWRVKEMRYKYNIVQRPHPKNNPDFERMACDGHYRIQMLEDRPGEVVYNS